MVFNVLSVYVSVHLLLRPGCEMSSKAHGYRHLVPINGGVWVGVHTSREGLCRESMSLRAGT